jgi:parvulin-like peptidyl-prolyl isomerase
LAWTAYQAEIRESIRQMKFNQLILQPRIVIDDNALQETYRQIKQQQPDVIDLYGIFLKNAPETKPAEEIAAALSVSLEEAQQMIQDMQRQSIEDQQQNLAAIQEQFSAGTSFQALAKRYDQSGLAGVSGSMGSFAKGQLRADLERIAFALQDGQMSEPLRVGSGVYLLYVDGRRKQAPPSFEEVKPQLMDAYYAQRFEQEMDIWYETAKSRAAIAVHLDEVETSMSEEVSQRD